MLDEVLSVCNKGASRWWVTEKPKTILSMPSEYAFIGRKHVGLL